MYEESEVGRRLQELEKKALGFCVGLEPEARTLSGPFCLSEKGSLVPGL